MNMHDKRRSERVDVQLSLQATWADTEFTGMILNVSLGGVLAEIELEPAPKVGDLLTLCFSLPALTEPVEVEAQVRWTSSRGLGLQFVRGLRAKETWALGRLLDEHVRV